MKGPEPFILAQNLGFACAVNPRRRAVVDTLHRARLNHEIFYVADRGALERFRRDPVRYAGVLTDPATLRRFRPTRHSPRVTHAGRLYLFPDSASLARFRSMPDSLAERKGA